MINFKRKIKGNNSGLTLVEMLVSMAIFGILSVSLVTLFTSAMNSQAAILQNQELAAQTGYVMEYMHRALRMADIDTTGGCTGTPNSNYGGDSEKISINFLGYDYTAAIPGYKCMQFSISGNIIQFKQSTDQTDDNFGAAINMTSSKVKVNELSLNVVGDTVNVSQPRVTIMIDAQSTSKRVSPVPTIKLQTTASQRNLNIQ
ncbi:MAG: prepilin-type N-terminal cleavage/methylation domain-containing protein [Candidatus Pacebacteria bacterium]|nr:prepilin-type N-terminal cleavage/methylation domain-containing protein [Candidatus Paceibacterota bacterium]